MEIYLDNAATTKVDPKVAKKVSEFFTENYGNASSQHHLGIKSKKSLDEAREKIAKYVSANISEIVFTSGGTESNNLALRGLAKANPEKKHIITSTIEHPSVLETCKDLEEEGCKIDYIKVNSEGIVEPEELEKKISKNTLVVSIMHVNNEIGTIQPIEEIAEICKKHQVYFHTDAVQGFSKIDLDIKNIDLFSVSGHKINAPKGVGFLYIKNGTKISPIITGGGQENKIRSGTENIPGIVGLAAALEIKRDKDEIKKSRDKIIKELVKIPGTKINGSIKNRIYNNINVSFYGIEGESLMLMLDKEGISISTGSACASTKLAESYVLKAIELENLYIHGSLRLSLDKDAIGKEDYIIKIIKENVEKLREISPFKLNPGEENDKNNQGHDFRRIDNE
jgi:cysteine desulfurase